MQPKIDKNAHQQLLDIISKNANRIITVGSNGYISPYIITVIAPPPNTQMAFSIFNSDGYLIMVPKHISTIHANIKDIGDLLPNVNITSVYGVICDFGKYVPFDFRKRILINFVGNINKFMENFSVITSIPHGYSIDTIDGKYLNVMDTYYSDLPSAIKMAIYTDFNIYRGLKVTRQYFSNINFDVYDYVKKILTYKTT